MPVCLQHPDRLSTTRCANCGKPLCRECVIRNGRNVFCSERCIEEFRRASGRAGGFIERERAFRRRKLLVNLIIAGAGAGLLALLAWFALRR